VRSLQVLAGQLAASVAQARLIDDLQDAARQNEALLQEAQASLTQIEELNRRLIREGWTEFIRERGTQGDTVGYTLASGQTHADDSWTAPMKQAYKGAGSVIIRQDEHSHVAAIPVRVRGEVVGVLEVERAPDRPWTDDDIAMAETLVERLALAVENARLYEQANRAVGREQLVNRVGQGVQSAGSVDEVLQTALTELSDILGARRGAVQISPERDNA
jgi:K+-sensing histidine kinase KdpD